MYILTAQLYWPISLLLTSIGRPYAGIVLGIIVVFAAWSIEWRMNFGTWIVGR
jgi:hypothetical protein